MTRPDLRIAQLEWALSAEQVIAKAYRKQRDELRGAVDAAQDIAQSMVDDNCYYRNLAIRLGAKPDEMTNDYDRKLCRKGFGVEGTESVEYERQDTIHAWERVDLAETERDELRLALERAMAFLQPGRRSNLDGAHHLRCPACSGKQRVEGPDSREPWATVEPMVHEPTCLILRADALLNPGKETP